MSDSHSTPKGATGGSQGDGGDDPLRQGEWRTLEAELRQALQHRAAAQEQADRTRAELQELMARARELLARQRSTSGGMATPQQPEP